jgi:hypothetical protein
VQVDRAGRWRTGGSSRSRGPRFCQWRHGPIIDEQHVDMAELVEMFRMAAVSARLGTGIVPDPAR